MKILNNVITYLIGALFLFAGGVYFLNLPVPAIPGDTGIWVKVMMSSGYMTVVKILEVVFGAMLLFNFKRPLAWLLLLPIVVNIVLTEVLIMKMPGIGLVIIVLNLYMIYVNRSHYKGVLK